MKVHELFKKTDADAIWREISQNHHGYDADACEEYELPEDPPEVFIKALEEMRTIEPLSSDEDLWRIVIVKHHKNYLHKEDEEHYDVTLIKNNENMRYCGDLQKWERWLDFDICETAIKWYGEAVCAAEIYWEMTFDGITNDDVNAAIADFEEACEESRARKEAGEQPKSHKEVIREIEEKYGKQVDDRTEEEIAAEQKRLDEYHKKSEEYHKIHRETYQRFLDEEIGAENVVEVEDYWWNKQ